MQDLEEQVAGLSLEVQELRRQLASERQARQQAEQQLQELEEEHEESGGRGGAAAAAELEALKAKNAKLKERYKVWKVWDLGCGLAAARCLLPGVFTVAHWGCCVCRANRIVFDGFRGRCKTSHLRYASDHGWCDLVAVNSVAELPLDHTLRPSPSMLGAAAGGELHRGD